MIRFAVLVLGCLLCFTSAWAEVEKKNSIPGEFDYYLASLSWSKEWCVVNEKYEQQQCSGDYDFILHGLWPQFEKGYPSDCQSEKLSLSPEQESYLLKYITPSEYLLTHEWDKHGTCSGLSDSDYYTRAALMFTSIRIPDFLTDMTENTTISKDDLKALLWAENRHLGLEKQDFTLVCDADSGKLKAKPNTLDEIRVCFDKQGVPRACSNADDACPGTIRVRVQD